MGLQNGGEGKGKGTCPPLINYQITREFPKEKDYGEYIRNVFLDFKFVKDFFPLLNIGMLPTLQPRELYIYGWLIPADLYSFMKSVDDIGKFGIYIHAYYPSDYPQENVGVEDICRTIDWKGIPEKHRHMIYISGRDSGLCTHHPLGEINDVPLQYRTVKILMSAWKLYFQYQKYIKTGIWDLPDLPHGDDALKILKRQGYKTI